MNTAWHEFQVWRRRTPWHLRWFYGLMRKMFGKDFTPAKIQMRLPRLVLGGIAMEAGLGRKRLVSLRYINWEKFAPRRGLVVLSE